MRARCRLAAWTAALSAGILTGECDLLTSMTLIRGRLLSALP
jgi:hypothetical protein